jgi:hypothetical protein
VGLDIDVLHYILSSHVVEPLPSRLVGLLWEGKQRPFRYSDIEWKQLFSSNLTNECTPGSASAEAFNRRIKIELPKVAPSLDDMVDFLAKEDLYWQRIAEDPRSWGERKTQHDSAQERHISKRRRLSRYIDRAKDTERAYVGDDDLVLDYDGSNQGDRGSDTDIDQPDDVVDSVSDDSNHPTLVPCSPHTTTTASIKDDATTTATTTTTKSRKRRKIINIPADKKCSCGYGMIHSECSLKSCKHCCIAVPEYCKEPSHKRDKLGARKSYDQISNTPLPTHPAPAPDNNVILPGVLEKVKSAIFGKKTLFISYGGGTNTDNPRKITPNALESKSKGELLKAFCFIDGKVKSFYLHKMKRVEDHDWRAPQGIASFLRIYFRCILTIF